MGMCVCGDVGVGMCGGMLVRVLNVLCNLFSVMHVNTYNINARWYGVPIPITCNYNYATCEIVLCAHPHYL